MSIASIKMRPPSALGVNILSSICEQSEPAEGPNDVKSIIDVNRLQFSREVVDRRRVCAATINSETPHVLDQVERLISGLLTHHIAQQSAEEADVVTWSAGVVCGHLSIVQ